MSDGAVLSDVNHQLQQTLDEVKNIVTAAAATIDEAQRNGEDDKVKSAFENVSAQSSPRLWALRGLDAGY